MSQPSAFLRTRVARRILGLFVLCAVLPVVLLATVVYRHVSQQLLDRGQARLVESSQTASMELAQRLQGIASAFERASVSVELRPREWAPDTVLRPALRDQGIAALVVEPTRARLYLGQAGTLSVATNAITHAAEEFDGKLVLGRDAGFSNRYFEGSLDDVRVYDHALTPAEVEALYLSSL